MFTIKALFRQLPKKVIQADVLLGEETRPYVAITDFKNTAKKVAKQSSEKNKKKARKQMASC